MSGPRCLKRTLKVVCPAGRIAGAVTGSHRSLSRNARSSGGPGVAASHQPRALLTAGAPPAH
eukprot:6072157-Pyramimonas_sp.AAC.1